MNILLDSSISQYVKSILKDAGYNVAWIGEWQQEPSDAEVITRAYRESRIIVTLDKDFGETAIVRRVSHCGIIRLGSQCVTDQGRICQHVIARYGEALRAGAVVTVEGNVVRIRAADREG